MYYLTKTKVSQRRKKLFGRFTTPFFEKEEREFMGVICNDNGFDVGFATLNEAITAARRDNLGFPLFFREDFDMIARTFRARSLCETYGDTLVEYEYSIITQI